MPTPATIVKQPSFSGPIGVARADITPPDGIFARSWGPATWSVPTGVHRPLTLTALAVVSSRPFVLLAVDLGWFEDRQDEWRVRSAVLNRLGLDPERLLVHLSHTHAGPSLCTQRADEPGGELIAPYLDALTEAAVDATERALATAQPCILSCGAGRCELAANRDLRDQDRTLVGFNPARAADDTMLVGRVSDRRGRTVATLVNYACHPTTLAWQNTLISPDFVGAMREVVESATDGVPCLFLQGASGELAPREQYVGDVLLADRHGRELGYAALGCLEGMPDAGNALVMLDAVESGAPLAMWSQRPHAAPTTQTSRLLEVELALKPLPEQAQLAAPAIGSDDTELSRELARAGLQPDGVQLDDHVRVERLRRATTQLAQYGSGSTFAYPVWIWRLGDLVVVAHPGEAYSDLQRQLRARHPDLAVVVLNVTNGAGPYLPSEPAYDCDAYPAWQTVFRPGCLEQVIEEADAGIAQLGVRAPDPTGVAFPRPGLH